MTPRPFRFGVTAGRVGSLPEWLDTARRVEAAGYSSLLLPDTTRTAAPLPALAAAAAATTDLHVGTWVLCEPLRNPAQLVWEARTLYELVGDRVELGLGAGRPGAEQDAAALGVPYGSAGERVARLRDTITTLRAQVPGLPLLVAASGPRLARVAGATADTVALGWPPATGTAAAREVVARVRAGGDPVLAAGLVAVGDVETPWLTHIGTSSAELAAQGAVTVVTGAPADMADTLRRRRDELGVSYVTVPVEALDALAPVVDLLTGS